MGYTPIQHSLALPESSERQFGVVEGATGLTQEDVGSGFPSFPTRSYSDSLSLHVLICKMG